LVKHATNIISNEKVSVRMKNDYIALFCNN